MRDRSREPGDDLGLWAICSAGVFLVAAAFIAVEVIARGLHPRLWQHVGVGLTVSVVAGWAMHLDYVKMGYRLTRRDSEQADDYDDGP